MATIIYRNGDEAMLDEIQELWEALNQHHGNISENFKSHYENFSFESRKRNLLWYLVVRLSQI